jgi:hypothetical protein
MDREPPPLVLNDEDDDSDLFRSAAASHSGGASAAASDHSESGYDTVNRDDGRLEGQVGGRELLRARDLS